MWAHMIWVGFARLGYWQLLSASKSSLNHLLLTCHERAKSSSQKLACVYTTSFPNPMNSSLLHIKLWWCFRGFVLTYLPGASWLHLIHINCVIRSSTKCVKLDVSRHTLHLDLPGTKRRVITPFSNIQLKHEQMFLIYGVLCSLQCLVVFCACFLWKMYFQ